MDWFKISSMAGFKTICTERRKNAINGAELMSENGSLRFVVGLNALASGYDANGNMTLRLKDGARYFLAYDAENRLANAVFQINGCYWQ